VETLQEFQQKRSEIFNAMLAALNTHQQKIPPEQASQFITARVAVIESALQGNLTARDEYLTTIVPGLKAGGLFSWSLASEVLTSMDAALLQLISLENAPWYATFFAEYTEKFYQIWEVS
jgi:hypothetical protein